MTTPESVQTSVDQLANERRRLLIQGRGFLAPMAGALDPVDGPDAVAAFVEGDGVSVGVRGRWNIADALTVLAGLETGQARYRGVSTDSADAGLLAVRYAPLHLKAQHPFFELGGWGHTGGDASFKRDYANGVGQAVGEASTTWSAADVWARAGWVWRLSNGGELSAFGEGERTRQALGDYAESLSAQNPFQAEAPSGSNTMTIGKLGVVSIWPWRRWSFAAGFSVAHAFDEKDNFDVAVPGFGVFTAGPIGRQTWVEYGGRASYSVNRHASMGVYVAGIHGGAVVSSFAHVGAEFRYTF